VRTVSENSWTSDNTTTWIGHINRQVEIPRRKSALILNLGVQNSATIHGYHIVTDFFRHPLLHELGIPHPHVPIPIDTPAGASQARSCFMAIKYRGDKPLLQVNGTCSLQFFQKLPGHIRRKFQCTICTRIQRIINASEGTLFELLSGLG
jgi:hypothetical protein